MFFRGFRNYLVSYILASGLENPMLIKSYIRQVLTTGYGTINFIKKLKGSGAPRASISNIKSRNNRIEHHSCKLEEMVRKEERLSFPKLKIREYLVICSMR